MSADRADILGSARRTSAVAYLIVFTLAVVAFERYGFIRDLGWIVLVPYVSVVLGAALVAYLVGGWYLSDAGWLEAALVPLVVVLVAIPVAGLAFALGSVWSGYGLSIADGSPPSEFITAAMWTGWIFLDGSWPVVLGGSAVASVLLYRRYHSEGMPPN